MFGGLFGKKKKTPEQLVQAIREALTAFDPSSESKDQEKVTTTLCERLAEVKVYLYGELDKESEPVPETCAALAEAFVEQDVVSDILRGLSELPFEARKDASQIIVNFTRHNHGNFARGYLAAHPELMGSLVDGYANPHVALNVGSILREAVAQVPELCKWLLESDQMAELFNNYTHVPNFEVASDAFSTVKEALTRHKAIVAQYLDEQFDKVFGLYTGLLQSDNYVTRRQSLKLLSELLLDRDNFKVMMRYISDRNNLKLVMMLLRDKRANIQFEAFHVFKVFVANPQKPAPITAILVQNKEKLIDYLRKFHNDKEDDQFTEEKALLIQTLQNMKMPMEEEAKLKKRAAAKEASAGDAAGAGDASGGASAESSTAAAPAAEGVGGASGGAGGEAGTADAGKASEATPKAD